MVCFESSGYPYDSKLCPNKSTEERLSKRHDMSHNTTLQRDDTRAYVQMCGCSCLACFLLYISKSCTCTNLVKKNLLLSNAMDKCLRHSNKSILYGTSCLPGIVSVLFLSLPILDMEPPRLMF